MWQPRHATWMPATSRRVADPPKTPESRIQPPGPLIERTQAKQETRTGQRGAKETGYLGAYRKAPPASVPESANGKVVSCVEPPRGTPQPRASICEPPVQPGSQATQRSHQAQPHAGGYGPAVFPHPDATCWLRYHGQDHMVFSGWGHHNTGNTLIAIVVLRRSLRMYGHY